MEIGWADRFLKGYLSVSNVQGGGPRWGPPLPTRLSADVDDDLAKGSAFEMFVRFTSFFKAVDLVDDRMDFVLVEEVVHSFECSGRRNGNAANSCLPEDDAHQVEIGSLALEKSDLRDVTTYARRFNRLVQAIAANNIEQLVDSLAIR